MARIYEAPQFGSQYEGAARLERYNPVETFDTSQVFKDKAARDVRDVETIARSAQRQFELDSSRLAAEKELGLAGMRANASAVNSLLALAPQALGAFNKIQEANQQMKQENELLDSIGWGEEAVAPTEHQAEIFKQNNAAISAESQGVAQVAQELKQEPSLVSQSAANTLQQSTTYNLTKGIQGNSYAASSMHGAYLQEFFRTLPAGKQPTTAAEAQVLIREANRQFLRETGMMGADRESLLRLARVMSGNTGNTLAGLVSQAIKSQQEANLDEARGLVSNIVDSGAGAQEIWDKVSERFAYGNLGYTGHSSESNKAALEGILAEAVENGNTSLIRDLRQVLQVPGQKGTELSNRYDHLFDKAEKQARIGAIQNYELKDREEALQTKQSIDFFYDNPSPENRQQAIRILRGIGSEDALKEADRLAAHGLSYDPQKKFELLELQQRGVDIPEETLRQLVTDGTITAAEYKQFAKSSVSEATSKQVDHALKEVSSQMKAAMGAGLGPNDMAQGVRAQVATRHLAMMEDLRSMVLAEVKVNPGLATDQGKLAELIEKKSQYLLKQPQYTLNKLGDGLKYEFAAPLGINEGRYQSITVAPGVQDFSRIKTEDIFKGNIPRSIMQANKDRFLSLNELKADAKAILNGGTPSNRSRLIAKNLGLSSLAFVESQLAVNGMPGIAALRAGDNSPDAALLTGVQNIATAEQGMGQLKQLGFPTRGAAYLAGNIQQESRWHGVRPSWEDGGAQSGGLVSWRAGRLRAIEAKFGRPISQISEPEQLQYMVQDMRKNYPDAYRVFMDPNASKAELRKASYKYWGWGEEGQRFRYAEELLQSPRPFRQYRVSTSRVSHPQTGSGYTAGGFRDASNRPVVMSQGAISAFAQMVKDSGGLVKPTDITSSQRSVEHNRSLPGAAPNSLHLRGNAMDIHGSSREWIRKNGARYGWRLHDYHGSHGGHFEFDG